MERARKDSLALRAAQQTEDGLEERLESRVGLEPRVDADVEL